MGEMSDNALGTDHRRQCFCGVDHSAVLNRGPRPDRDVSVISTQHGTWPDRCTGPNLYVADYNGLWMDICGRVNDRLAVADGIDRHGTPLGLSIRLDWDAFARHPSRP